MSGERTDDRDLLDVARVWREERVSCPHQDVLRAYDAGALDAGAMEFLQFHLETSQCPYCNAVLDDLRAGAAAAQDEAFTDLKDRLLRSTRTALRRRSAGD